MSKSPDDPKNPSKGKEDEPKPQSTRLVKPQMSSYVTKTGLQRRHSIREHTFTEIDPDKIFILDKFNSLKHATKTFDQAINTARTKESQKKAIKEYSSKIEEIAKNKRYNTLLNKRNSFDIEIGGDLDAVESGIHMGRQRVSLATLNYKLNHADKEYQEKLKTAKPNEKFKIDQAYFNKLYNIQNRADYKSLAALPKLQESDLIHHLVADPLRESIKNLIERISVKMGALEAQYNKQRKTLFGLELTGWELTRKNETSPTLAQSVQQQPSEKPKTDTPDTPKKNPKAPS